MMVDALVVRRRLRATLAVLLMASFAFRFAPRVEARQERDALLDVPYIAQSVLLCGGAAAAMVLRYWGDTRTVPGDFASLVNEADGGIRTTALTSAVAARGWTTVPVAVDAGQSVAPVRTEINRGRPVIALLEVAPRTFHYVVVVAIAADSVVLHDPARAPFIVTPRAEFERQWAGANRWMLVILPSEAPAPSRAEAASAPPAPVSGGRCASLVQRGVETAKEGNLDAAARALAAATTICPEDGAGWRELAGVRFVEKNYAEAGRLAAVALARAPGDPLAVQLLATSQFLRGDQIGALAHWNLVGEPRIGLVSVEGATRTRQPAIVDRTGLRSRDLFTPDAFRRAAHRLEDLPAAAGAAVRYDVDAASEATVRLLVSERRALPTGPIGWAALGIRTAFVGEIEIGVPNITGEGDLLTPAYRWQKNRPRAGFAFAVPAPGVLPGVLSLGAWWERQTYAPFPGDDRLIREDQRRVDVSLADWATGWLHWRAGVAGDRFGERDYIAVSAATTIRVLDDRLAAIGAVEQWTPASTGASFSTSRLALQLRTSALANRPKLTGSLSLKTATKHSPFGVWPGAGTGRGRSDLLRAHPLVDEGVITGEIFGRGLIAANIEYVHPAYVSAYGNLGIAGFVDLARATHRRTGSPKGHLDLGMGLRIAAPGMASALRLDVGYATRDGNVSVSAGYLAGWGR